MPRGDTAGFVALWTRFAVQAVEPGGGLAVADPVTQAERAFASLDPIRPVRAVHSDGRVGSLRRALVLTGADRDTRPRRSRRLRLLHQPVDGQ
jgi:hypothetical protein